MKKLLKYILVIGGLLYLPVQGIAIAKQMDAKAGISYEYTPEEGSIEELYKDIIVTQLEPVISKEVEKQYGQALLYGLYDVRFMEVEREAYRGFNFLIKLQIEPFVGAHNPVGKDELVIRIKPGKTEVESFKHLEDY